jgi:rhodanese-related sulfurtransferase
MKHISPQNAQQLGYTVVDVREFPEYAAGAIAGSQLVPLGSMEREAGPWAKDRPLLLVCRSGKRAAQAAQKLEQLGFQNLAILEGGMEAWQQARLPVAVASRKPWSLERQVRVMAGGMVVVSGILGLVVTPWFFGWTLFVGAGLVFAGVTDVCMMASLLGKLPWNRPGSAGPPCGVRSSAP